MQDEKEKAGIGGQQPIASFVDLEKMVRQVDEVSEQLCMVNPRKEKSKGQLKRPGRYRVNDGVDRNERCQHRKQVTENLDEHFAHHGRCL